MQSKWEKYYSLVSLKFINYMIFIVLLARRGGFMQSGQRRYAPNAETADINRNQTTLYRFTDRKSSKQELLGLTVLDSQTLPN